MTEILRSDNLAEKIKDRIKRRINKENMTPRLATIRIGDNPGDVAYERGIIKSASELNINVVKNTLDKDVSEKELLDLIYELNTDNEIDGIIIFRPIPEHIDIDKVNLAISPKKDLDCLNPINKSNVYSGNVDGFIPLSPKAAIMLLEEYGYDVEEKDCVIVNDSSVVGKPLSMILLAKEATVTICHSRTKDLREKTKNADIVFTAIGQAEYFDSSYFSENSVIIDIGVSRNEKGKMSGDLAKDIDGFVKAYSPVPGGIGKLTNLLLLESLFNYKYK